MSKSSIRIDLNVTPNNNCITGCNKEKRKDLTENDICIKTNSKNDNLPVRCVREWSLQKIYLLIQYFGIFSNGMKKKWTLNYIEICSGPGRCINRSNGDEFDGTSLSIVKHPSYQNIKKAIFFDFNQNVIKTLNKRLQNLHINNAKALLGDYTKPVEISNILRNEFDPNSLNLCFIDPTDCSVPFTLVKEIKNALSNVDFIINLASGTDFSRNIKNAIKKYHINLFKKYSSFLGNTNFFEDNKVIQFANENNTEQLRNLFREYYIQSMKKIGYLHFEFKRIKPYYDILFATSNKKGIEFWNKATNINFDGQRKLF